MSSSRTILALVVSLLCVVLAGFCLEKIIRFSLVDWHTAIAKVDSFQAKARSSNYFNVSIVYNYSIKNKAYKGNQIIDGPNAVMSMDQITETFGSFSPKTVSVFYNKSNPRQHVLIKPSLSFTYILFGASLLLALSIFWFMFFVDHQPKAIE